MFARHATRRSHVRVRFARAVGAAAVAALVVPLAAAPSAVASTPDAPTITRLSAHRGLTWGGDQVVVSGTGFDGTHGRRVATVLFGKHKADWFSVESACDVTPVPETSPIWLSTLDSPPSILASMWKLAPGSCQSPPPPPE